jgi:NAD(P)-dependent dehydrogenase (short-subunit alcohol dehydrogenase family)
MSTTGNGSRTGRLDGKVAVISGATGGMGRAACRIFLEEGATVIGVDLSAKAGQALADELDVGKRFAFEVADVSSNGAVVDLAARVKERFGGIDVLYNNAGTCVGKHVLETTEEEWDGIHDVTLKGTFLMTKAFAPLMAGRKGSIVNVSSTGGLVALPNMSAYCAAKGGVLLLTKAMAADLAPDIRVNAICPGAIDTPMLTSLFREFPGQPEAEVRQAFADGHLQKRIGEADEVVRLSAFLASDEASFITGAGVSVDGGFTTT